LFRRLSHYGSRRFVQFAMKRSAIMRSAGFEHPHCQVTWGFSGEVLNINHPYVSVSQLCCRLAEYKQATQAMVSLVRIGSSSPLPYSRILNLKEDALQAICSGQLPPRIYMAQACQFQYTWNSRDFSSCGEGDVSVLSFTGGLRVPPGLPGLVPPIMQSTAERVEYLIRGISLPAANDDFEGKAFVLYSGTGACDLSTLFLEAFGALDPWLSEACVSSLRLTEGFDDRFGYDGDDQEGLERLAQAAHVLRTFGSTYLLEFSYDDIPVPTFYFARKDEEAACVGVLVGETKNLNLHSTLYGDFTHSVGCTGSVRKIDAIDIQHPTSGSKLANVSTS
jgi:hypothetical protein